MPGTANNSDPGATVFEARAVCEAVLCAGRDYGETPGDPHGRG